MALTGDWERLRATVRGLNKLASVPSRASAKAARGIKAEIGNQFAAEVNPYGRSWAPHKPATVKRWGNHSILRLTGSGASEIDVSPMPGAGIVVTSPSEGLAFAQGGTVNEETRAFLPTDTMPKTWRRIIESAVTSEIESDLEAAK